MTHRAEIEREVRRHCQEGTIASAAAAAIRGYGPKILGFLSQSNASEREVAITSNQATDDHRMAAPSPLDALLTTGEALTRGGDVGLCREVLGRCADAHRLVARVLEGAPPETTPAGKAPRWVALRSALRRLDERVARAGGPAGGEPEGAF